MIDKMREKLIKLRSSTIADANVVSAIRQTSTVSMMRSWIEKGLKEEQKELNIKSLKK